MELDQILAILDLPYLNQNFYCILPSLTSSFKLIIILHVHIFWLHVTMSCIVVHFLHLVNLRWTETGRWTHLPKQTRVTEQTNYDWNQKGWCECTHLCRDQQTLLKLLCSNVTIFSYHDVTELGNGTVTFVFYR